MPMLLRQALLKMEYAFTLPRQLAARTFSSSSRGAYGRPSPSAAVRSWVASPAVPAAASTSSRGIASSTAALGKAPLNVRNKSAKVNLAATNATKMPFAPAVDFDDTPAATFGDMRLHPDVAQALGALGFEKPTDIQVSEQPTKISADFLPTAWVP